MSLEKFIKNQDGGLEQHLKVQAKKYGIDNPDITRTLKYIEDRYSPLTDDETKFKSNVLRGLGAGLKGTSTAYMATTGDVLTGGMAYTTGSALQVPEALSRMKPLIQTYDPKIIGLGAVAALSDIASPDSGLVRKLTSTKYNPMQTAIQNKATQYMLKTSGVKRSDSLYKTAQEYLSKYGHQIKHRAKNIIDPHYQPSFA